MDAPLFSSLQEKVDPQHTAVVVVDVQNDFCAPGGWFDKARRNLTEIQSKVKTLSQFLASARRHGVSLVFVRCNYDEGFLSANVKERYQRKKYGVAPCQPGTWGAEFYVVKPEGGEFIVTKHRYDAFEGTDLDVVLRSNGVHTVLMTGVTTECCVESTARHAFMKGYYVVLVSDCAGTYDPALQQMTERNVEELFGVVTTSGQVKEIWESLAAKKPAPRKRVAVQT